MNTKGIKIECSISKVLHLKGKGLIVDPLFLRRNCLGQVDIAFIKNKELYIIECKASLSLKPKQAARLKKSVHVLSGILGLRGSLYLSLGLDYELHEICGF